MEGVYVADLEGEILTSSLKNGRKLESIVQYSLYFIIIIEVSLSDHTLFVLFYNNFAILQGYINSIIANWICTHGSPVLLCPFAMTAAAVTRRWR